MEPIFRLRTRRRSGRSGTRIHPFVRLPSRIFSRKKGNKGGIDWTLVMGPGKGSPRKGRFFFFFFFFLALDVKNLALRPSSPMSRTPLPWTSQAAIFHSRKSSSWRHAQDNPPLKYSGNLSVDRLATIDRARANDFLKWKQLRFESRRRNQSSL